MSAKRAPGTLRIGIHLIVTLQQRHSRAGGGARAPRENIEYTIRESRSSSSPPGAGFPLTDSLPQRRRPHKTNSTKPYPSFKMPFASRHARTRHCTRDTPLTPSCATRYYRTGKKTPGGAGTHTGRTQDTRAHKGTRVTPTNCTGTGGTRAQTHIQLSCSMVSMVAQRFTMVAPRAAPLRRKLRLPIFLRCESQR